MSIEYIRKAYGVPAKRGMRVTLNSHRGIRTGRITSASSHYVHVRFDDSTKSAPLHPADPRLTYHTEESK